jgi:hypothetical protein
VPPYVRIMTTGDDDDLAGRLQRKMTDLKARQALEASAARSLAELGVQLEGHAQLLRTNTRLLESLLPLLQACPRCTPGADG